MGTESKNRTEQSLADGFGGDSYRRREVSDGVYQCGCHWVRYEEPVEVIEGVFVRGDVLVECPFHKTITEEDIKKMDE